MSFSADANKITTWVGVGNTTVFLLGRNCILIRHHFYRMISSATLLGTFLPVAST